MSMLYICIKGFAKLINANNTVYSLAHQSAFAYRRTLWYICVLDRGMVVYWSELLPHSKKVLPAWVSFRDSSFLSQSTDMWTWLICYSKLPAGVIVNVDCPSHWGVQPVPNMTCWQWMIYCGDPNWEEWKKKEKKEKIVSTLFSPNCFFLNKYLWR